MLEGLEWAREGSAYCVIFARGLDETELLRRLGGDLSTARLVGPEESYVVWEAMRQHFEQVVRVGWCDGWAFAYEWNGLWPRPETMRALSAGTAAISVYLNVNARTRFCYAVDGTLVADFNSTDGDVLAFFAASSPKVQALLLQAGITLPGPEDEDDGFDSVEAMHALTEAAGARLDRESIAEKPLLISGITSYSAV